LFRSRKKERARVQKIAGLRSPTSLLLHPGLALPSFFRVFRVFRGGPLLWRIKQMAKQLLYTDEARKKLLAGADKLAHAVGLTLGPTGRNVIIDKSFGGPTVTKDGVTVSKEIDLPDPFENMGAKLVNAVAQKTSDVAGDGTT